MSLPVDFNAEPTSDEIRFLTAKAVEPRTGTYASDHYGLSVDVAWPTLPSIPNHQRS